MMNVKGMLRNPQSKKGLIIGLLVGAVLVVLVPAVYTAIDKIVTPIKEKLNFK